MATATKKKAAKKRPAKKAAAKKTPATKPKNEKVKRSARGTAEQQSRVVKLREKDELKWVEIADHVGVTTGQAMFWYLCATEEPYPAKTEAAMAKAIVKDRDKGASWGLIAARSGMGEAACRTAYTNATGDDTKGLRVGKGGRYPGDANPNEDAPASKPAKKAPAKKKAVAKKAAKKAPAKKAAAKRKKALADMTPAQVVKALKGKQVKLKDDTVVQADEVEVDGHLITLVSNEDGPIEVDVAEIAAAA